ncbi:LacI family DNA-binding transcriptional regulator [Treponema sp. OMZ 840]|uniref:LacI family DNA-binding transcriptional regulator n=1 Tax=Treponema sp. OMZ 840 TaxID=244313 RepID=UPI003D8B66FB
MAKKITLQDIANATGTSKSAVSMILSKKQINRFSSATIEAVQAAAFKLGYFKAKFKKNILIVQPTGVNPYYAGLRHGMDQKAIELNYNTLLYNTYWDKEREKEVINLVKGSNIDAVIFSMIPQNHEIANMLNGLLPIVVVGDHHSSLQMDTVEIDNFNAGQIVAAYLAKLGHRKLAYLSTSLNSNHSARTKRIEGIKNYFMHHHAHFTIKVFSKDILPAEELENMDIEYDTGYMLAKRCLQDFKEVTAIVAINDMVAYGVMDALNDSHLVIPKNCSICAFDNIFPSKTRAIGLTTTDHNIVQQGKHAVNLIHQKFCESDQSSNLTRVQYKCTLMKRSSTGVVPT